METGQRLHELKIGRPCDVPWGEMEGDDQIRRCEFCEKSVYNFSEMNASEILTCLRSEGGVCAQIRRSSDGRILTKENSSKLRSRQFSLFSLLAITTAVATLFGFASHFNFGPTERLEEESWEGGGDISVPEDFFEDETE
jgi:hypothetical protein